MSTANLFAALVAISAPGAEPAAVSPPPTSRPPVKRYCIKDRREGAAPGPKICRSREEWRARGFDPVLVLNGR